jgi:hypothetical protein
VDNQELFEENAYFKIRQQMYILLFLVNIESQGKEQKLPLQHKVI